MVAPGLAQQVEVQPIVIVFTRIPAHAMGVNLLNYTTKEGQQLYDACAPLVDKFNGEPTKLKLFLLCFKNKATQSVWMPMLTHLVNNCSCNLCDHYGEITQEQIQQ